MVTGEQGKAPIVDRYSVVLADPPWRYAFSMSRRRTIEKQYPTMSTDDICRMEVPSAKDSVLFLWATAPKLEDALRVLNAWGYRYKSHIVWDKIKIGMGYWARGQHELLLVGTKGKVSPPSPSLRVRSVLRIPRTIHSRKPAEIRDMISRWFPNEKKLEMFARERVENWDAWGNEVECDIELSIPDAMDRGAQ